MPKHIILQGEYLEYEDLIISSLLKGKIIVYPADTVYGFYCDYRNKNSVNTLVRLKKRSPSKSFLLVAAEISQAEKIIEIPEHHEQLLNRYWPGPLTGIFKAKTLPQWIVQGGGVALRVTGNSFARKLISKYGYPLISTSLNISGDKQQLGLNDIDRYFKAVPGFKELSYICEDLSLKIKLPSTIADLRNKEIKIIREGIISSKELIESQLYD